MTTIEEKMGRLTKERRGRIEQRARKLIAEEMSLRDLRKSTTQDSGTQGPPGPIAYG